MASNYMTPHTRTLMTKLKTQFDRLEARMNDKIDSIIKRLENYRSSNPPKQHSTLTKSIASSITTYLVTSPSYKAFPNRLTSDKDCDEEKV